jgi:hypothetical protein
VNKVNLKFIEMPSDSESMIATQAGSLSDINLNPSPGPLGCASSSSSNLKLPVERTIRNDASLSGTRRLPVINLTQAYSIQL